MIIAVPDPDSKEFPYGSNVTYIAKFFKKEEKNRSLTSTGSDSKKNCTDPNTGYFMLAFSKINRCFNAKKIFSNPYCKISNVFNSNMDAYVKVPVAMGC
jgi:hypothetical protein